MPITLNDLTVNFDHLDGASLIEDWQWLVGESRYPILITALGDAFLQDSQDGSVHLLCVGVGGLERIADGLEQFRDLLSSRAFVQARFVPALIIQLRELGHVLEPGQLYGYRTPPVLGGSLEADNLEPTDIALHFSLLGQIMRQVRDLPPGTPISRITID